MYCSNVQRRYFAAWRVALHRLRERERMLNRRMEIAKTHHRDTLLVRKLFYSLFSFACNASHREYIYVRGGEH